MNRGERLIRCGAGVVLLAESFLLGAITVDAVASNEPSPEGLVFQNALHGDDQEPFTHYEILNGTFLNLVAVGGLANAGANQLRQAVRNTHTPTV